MSLFRKMFGIKEKKLNTQEILHRRREVKEMLVKNQEFLKKKIEVETAVVKKNGRVNKVIAMQALKRKKGYEKQLQEIDDQLSKLSGEDFDDDFNCDELERELEDLLKEDKTNVGISSVALHEVSSPSGIDIPSILAEKTPKPNAVNEDEDDMKKLGAWTLESKITY